MIRLTSGKIAVDPMFEKDVTDGGIIIPDEAKSKVNQGIVKYVGPDVRTVSIGDYVLFSAYSGSTVRIEGEGLFIILHEDFVTCLIEPPETEISGLFFCDRDGEYWPATHEMAIHLIQLGLRDAGHMVKGNVLSRPAVNEIKRGI